MRIKNGLVVGVIFLFVGVAVQPSIATIQPKQIEVEPTVDDVEGLVAQLRVVINKILQDYGRIPIIRTLCDKIVGILDLFELLLICIFLIIITILYGHLLAILLLLRWNPGGIIIWLMARIFVNFYEIQEYCGELRSNFPLKFLSKINRIVASDSSTLTGLDECPCMQQ